MQLTQSQKRAVRCFEEGKNMFLTGEAGTGKSTLIRHFQALMPEMSITATTGTAAFLIGGQTLHSWAGLGIAFNPSVESALRFLRRRKSKAIDRWKTCKCLVIDEISMLSICCNI